MSSPRSRLTFLRGHSSFSHFLICCAFSFVLILIDVRFRETVPLRLWLESATAPVHAVVDFPVRLLKGLHFLFSTRAWLSSENDRLIKAYTSLAGDLLKLQSLEAENEALRDLLAAPLEADVRTMVALPLRMKDDPFTQQMVIDKGRQDGVFVGQPVADAAGIIGVVVQTHLRNSRIMLLSDPMHGVPVRVLRTGQTAIAEGTGGAALNIGHISDDSDVQPGDLLVTSGLGGRFPSGYPVATVESVTHVSGDPFLKVIAKPRSLLQRYHPVILLFGPNNVVEDDA